MYATGTVQGDPLFTEYGDVDTAAIVVRFDGGALGVVSNARYNARGYDCRLEVHGFNDSVVAGWDQGVPVRNTDPANDFPTGPPHNFFMDRFTEAFRTELAGVRRGGQGRPGPRCDGRRRGRGRLDRRSRHRIPAPGRAGHASRRFERRHERDQDRRRPDFLGRVRGPGWGYQLDRSGC